MITFDEAQKRLNSISPQPQPETVSTKEASGRVLSEPINAKEDMPRFRNAAMDGYAVRRSDLDRAKPDEPVRLEKVGVAAAGDPVGKPLSSGEAVRIFTGAPVPEDATAVVMQEHVTEIGNTVVCSDPVEKDNIRCRGEEFKAGDLLFEKQTVLNPAARGMLLEQGYTNIPVFKTPSISIVNTGDELVDASQQPGPGQIRDSIGPTLQMALQEEGHSAVRYHATDDEKKMKSLLETLLNEQDVVLISGGVSVGDRDLTRPVLEDLSVEQVFWKVHQKPGKPIYFGRRNDTYVLGLPGNPVSSMVCFYLYGLPLIRNLSGYPDECLHLHRTQTELADPYETSGKRTEFIRARTRWEEDRYVSRKVERQGSHMLGGLAVANSIVQLSSDSEELNERTYPVYFLSGRIS